MQGKLRRLAQGPQQHQPGHDEQPGGAHLPAGVLGRQRLEVELIESEIDVEDADQQPGVADQGDQEGLAGGAGRRRSLPPVADEQVRAGADQEPEEEQGKVVVGQHHAFHGERQEGGDHEEADVAGIAAHGLSRIELDDEADGGDHHQHHGGQAVGRHPPLELELGRRTRLVGKEGEVGRVALQVERMDELDGEDQHRRHQRQGREDDGDPAAHPPRVNGEGQDDDEGAERRKERQQLDERRTPGVQRTPGSQQRGQHPVTRRSAGQIVGRHDGA